MAWIERQIALEDKYKENDQEHYQVRGQHVQRIALPIHWKADQPAANEPIEEIVDRIEDGVGDGLAVHEHAGQIAAGGYTD